MGSGESPLKHARGTHLSELEETESPRGSSTFATQLLLRVDNAGTLRIGGGGAHETGKHELA